METTRDLGCADLWAKSLEQSLARRGRPRRASVELYRLKPARDLSSPKPLRESSAYWHIRRTAVERAEMPLTTAGSGAALALLAATTLPSLLGRGRGAGTAIHATAVTPARAPGKFTAAITRALGVSKHRGPAAQPSSPAQPVAAPATRGTGVASSAVSATASHAVLAGAGHAPSANTRQPVSPTASHATSPSATHAISPTARQASSVGPAGAASASAAAPPATAVHGSTGTPTFIQGSVASIQRRLGVAADGVLGPHTAAAVRSFQAARGLAVDGIVGPATLAALTHTVKPVPVHASVVAARDAVSASAAQTGGAAMLAAPAAPATRHATSVTRHAASATRPAAPAARPAAHGQGVAAHRTASASGATDASRGTTDGAGGTRASDPASAAAPSGGAGTTVSRTPAKTAPPTPATTTPRAPVATTPRAPAKAAPSPAASGLTGVQALQQRLGLAVDGSFGPLTKAAVERFQRAHGLSPNGVVGPATRAALGLGPGPVLSESAPPPVAAPTPTTSTGVTTPSGGPSLATPTPSTGASAEIAAMIGAGNAIATRPYVYGGGHGSFDSLGYDCSGSVSYVLHAAGLLSSPEDSSGLESYGAPGPGRYVTIYANAGHAFMTINGRRFDTIALQETGTRWSSTPGSTSGYVVRHPVGL